MKSLFFLFACLTQTTFSFSQGKNNSSFSLSVGPAIPSGKFAGKDLSNESTGFAKTGEAFSLSYTKFISKTLGLMVGIHGQRNPIDTKEFESNFAKTFSRYPNWQFDKRSWLFGSLLLGGTGQFAFKESDKVSLITKVMAGVIYSKSPGLYGNSVNENTIAIIEQTKKYAIGFSYSVGGGINYDLNKKIFFNSLLTYNGTNKMTYKNIRTTILTSQGTPGSPDHALQQTLTTIDVKQTITSINLSVGIGIKL